MAKMKACRPILVGRNVVCEGDEFETDELHARELVAKGYAVGIDIDGNSIEPSLEGDAASNDAETDHESSSDGDAAPEQAVPASSGRKARK